MFCEHCGKELKDGEVCNCQNQNNYTYVPPQDNKTYIPMNQAKNKNRSSSNKKTNYGIIITIIVIVAVAMFGIIIGSDLNDGSSKMSGNSQSSKSQVTTPKGTTGSVFKVFSADFVDGDNGSYTVFYNEDEVRSFTYTWEMPKNISENNLKNAKFIHEHVNNKSKEGVNVESTFSETSSGYELKLRFYFNSQNDEEIETASEIFEIFDEVINSGTVKMSLLRNWLVKYGYKESWY